MASTAIRIGRERKELLARYASASVFLYGAISVGEFVTVFNRYEAAGTDAEEALLALKRLARTDDVEYSIKGDLITAPEFQPGFSDYEENVAALRARQQGKPRYLPDREEFLKFSEGRYREPEKPYADLRAYILDHKLSPRGEGIEGVDGDLIDLHEMTQAGESPTEVLKYFSSADYQFSSLDEFKEFARLVMETGNNTRLYINNGFTPHELFETHERPKLRPLPSEPFVIPSVPKVGRNDPCPCGSGLKYKKCHGR